MATRKRRRTFPRRRSGAPLFAPLAIGAMIGLVALAIDEAQLYTIRNRLQETADAAALAAANRLPDQVAAAAAATDHARKNLSFVADGITLAEVEFGVWDRATRTFTPGGGPINAVLTTVRGTRGNGNSAEAFFATIVGVNELEMTARAVANVAAIRPRSRGLVLAKDTTGSSIQ